jgi:rhamnosyltransferase
MDEGLFIDHVDTEWCFRAQSRQYKLFGVPSARMLHSLGDHRIRIWFLRWRTVSFHSPARYYYILRNSLLLQRRSYIPLKWRVAEGFRCLRLLLFYGLFSPRRMDCLRMMFKGISHGLQGVTGPLKF